MEVTLRDFLTAVHGLLFGGFFLMAVFGIVVELYRSANEKQTAELTARGYSLERAYLIVTVALGWAAVLSGAYIVYPWYRAIPPGGAANLVLYPQRLLLSSATTSGWHTLGMEWKEHVAWFAPIAMTMLAYMLIRYRGVLRQHSEVKRAVLVFMAAVLLATGIAGFFGTMIDKAAPVQGGGTIVFTGGAK